MLICPSSHPSARDPRGWGAGQSPGTTAKRLHPPDPPRFSGKFGHSLCGLPLRSFKSGPADRAHIAHALRVPRDARGGGAGDARWVLAVPNGAGSQGRGTPSSQESLAPLLYRTAEQKEPEHKPDLTPLPLHEFINSEYIPPLTATHPTSSLPGPRA